jgi:hypothetical protein
MPRRFPTLLVMAILLSAGCASHTPRAFEGPDRPDDQVAVLEIDPDVRFVSLNGKPVKGVPSELAKDSPLQNTDDRRFIRLLPGEYRIVVGYAPFADEPWHSRSPGGTNAAAKTYAGSAENDELLLAAAAGKRYLVKIDLTYKLDADPPTRWSAAVYDQDRSAGAEHPVSKTITGHAAAATRP